MSKIFNLTEEQLDFVSFMKEMTTGHEELNARFESCLTDLTSPSNIESKDRNLIIESRHSPHKMIEFLSLFSKDDYFKWFTHKWDQNELTLENLINEQPRKKIKLSNRVYKTAEPVNERTYNQIWNFINFKPEKDYPWTGNDGTSYHVGWHSILDSHKQYPDLPVENLKLANGHIFKDYIRMFKASIEFRTDLNMDDRFNRVIRNYLKKTINGSVELEFSHNFKTIGRDLNIYCDVPSLLFSLGIISDWIVKHKVNGTLVTVDLIVRQDCYELVILHHNSYLSNENKLINPSGDFANLRNRLFSVCDFTLTGDLKNDSKPKGSIIIYGLSEDTVKINSVLSQCSYEYSDEPIGGVKYILKLYKS